MEGGGEWVIRYEYPRTMSPNELHRFRTTDSFDDVAEAFGQHIDSDEPLELLIRGHLWIESALTTLVQRSLPRPRVIEKAGLSFNQRLLLADALGLLDEDEARAMRQINQLRNRAAHRLHDLPREEDQAQLLGSCSERLRHIAGVDPKRSEFPKGLAQIIATLVIILHRKIDDLDASRRYSVHLHQRVEALRARLRTNTR